MRVYEDYKKIKLIAFCVIFVLSLLVSISYGFKKSGFHEDEYYTYFSSNRTYGLFQPDREWQDRQTVLDEFVVREGERFNYSLVRLVQSWDVHPPVYYYIFHTVCSFVPGVFTKWSGIAANLAGFALAYLFFCLLMEEMNTPAWVEIMTLIFWGLNPQTVSCNMLIRMYSWLGAAVLACAYLHIKLIKDFDNNALEPKTFVLKSLLPVVIASFIGFLIQYFFIFFFFIIGFETAVYIAFFKKDIKCAGMYTSACALSMILAVLYYPASLHHMLGGYRGGDAAGSFFDPANTWMRLSFFVGLLNDYVFAGGLIVLALIIFLGVILGMNMGSKKRQAGIDARVVILAAAAISYFLLTSKTALLVGEASNRYEMPIYALIIYLIFYDLYHVAARFKGKALTYVLTVVIIMLLAKGHFYDRHILFLYPEDVEKMEYAKENTDSVAVVMFNPATPHNVWRLTDELLMYDKVYYMDEENLDRITDGEVADADKIILYAADDDLKEKAFDNLLSSTGLATMTEKFSEDMWTTYEIR